MKCLTEIAGVTVPYYDEKFIAMFQREHAAAGDYVARGPHQGCYKKGSDAERCFLIRTWQCSSVLLKEQVTPGEAAKPEPC